MDPYKKRRGDCPQESFFGGGGGNVPADRETRRILYTADRENRG